MSSEEVFTQIQALQRKLLYSFERCTGMSASRMQLLSHLYQSEEISQTSLQKLVGIDHAAITRHLKQLEAENLVSRHTSSQDNRVTLVNLTDNGREKLVTLMAGREQFLNGMLQGFDEQELNHLASMLHRINENLGKL